MEKCFSRMSFIACLFFTGYAYCSQWPEWVTDAWKEKLIEAGITPCFLEPGIFLTEQEIAGWFDAPHTGWNLRKNLSAWYAGKSRIERFFDELKHPDNESLPIIRHAIFEDDEMRYALDPKTGLPPVATLMVAYLNGTEDEKKLYRTIFEYLLEVETSCSYNLEHQAPLSFHDEQLDDLKAIFLRYHANDSEGWQLVCDRLKEQSNTQIRLSSVVQALSYQEKAAEQKNSTKQQEQSTHWYTLLAAVGIAVGYGLYRYLNKDAGKNDSVVREHTAEYAQLFRGV